MGRGGLGRRGTEGIPGRRNSLSKGSEAGANVVCLGSLWLRVATLKGQITEETLKRQTIPFGCTDFKGYAWQPNGTVKAAE